MEGLTGSRPICTRVPLIKVYFDRSGEPCEALTTPALLSQRERREKNREGVGFFPLSPPGREGSGE
jgi:hypothetical protein